MNHLCNIIIITNLVFFPKLNYAHEHHHQEESPYDDTSYKDNQVDAILWTHIVFMFIAFALIFPTGMVLGLSKSKLHAPVQFLGTIIGVIGYFLGHSHGGKEFSENNIHSLFAPVVVFLFLIQIGAGIYLKLHRIIVKNHNLNNKHFVRLIIQKFHSIIGITFPITSYLQIIFGIITLVDWCKDDHISQCLAHFIMGSSFIAYGIIIIIMLKIGSIWLQKNNKSPEFYDSIVMLIWGFVNTWTEHRWNTPWSHKDLQHTALGIIWWAGGLSGLYFVRNGKRNIFPALVIIYTGFAMSSHQQSSEFSTIIHAIFGFTLMAAGLTRIIEVCFFENAYNNKKLLNNPFLILPSYLLILSGLLFMGANEEQISLLVSLNVDPYSYILVQMSISFLIFLFINLLIDLYVRLTNYKNVEKNIGVYQELNELEISSYHIAPNDDDDLRKSDEKTSSEIDNYNMLSV